MNDLDLALVEAALPLIAESTGVDFRGYRLPMVSRRLRNHMLALGGIAADKYLEQLRSSDQTRTAALERITIKVSRFFRNPAAFTRLAEALAHQRTERDVWVAGCSTGEEVWSIALLLHEAGIQARIVATDIDTTALQIAARGRYPAEVMRDVPARFAGSFEPSGDHHVQIAGRFRTAVDFVRHDLTREAPPVHDALLVSCRNVMIYFQREYQAAAHHTLLEALTPGGLLLLGEAEWMSSHALGSVSVLSATHRLFQRLQPSRS